MEMLNKKGQTRGLVTGLVIGIAALVIGVIIAFVIVSTLNNSSLIDTSGRVTTTVTNEATWINLTGNTLANVNVDNTNYVAVAARNTTSGQTILAGNYSLNSITGILTNVSTTNWGAVSLNYTYQTLTDIEKATNKISTNLTSGVNNISSKIPTVLLIAAIVLILGILAVLVGVWQKMRMGGGSI